MTTSFWFKSSKLQIIEGEDDQTNPMRYGKSVAEWIGQILNQNGFESQISPDDWGWRVDCTDEPCPIWIGCGNVDAMNDSEEFVTPTNEVIIWHVFIEADIPFFRKLVNRPKPESKILEIANLLSSALQNSEHIIEVEEP